MSARRYFLMMSLGSGEKVIGSTTVLERSAASVAKHAFQCCLTGTTAQRPALGDPDFPSGVQAGIPYYDSTLTYVVFSDGKNGWRNPANGASV